MHFNVRIKATKANSKTRTKRVKKTATQVDATPSVDVKPIIVPAEPEEEWVTLPQAGDCISLRLDNEASINHLPTQAEIQYLQRLPTETKRYLAIVTGVLTAPTQKQPWCTCVVHILPPPPTQGGTIQDFHPRHWTVVRLRPREARREPLFAVAPRLADALYREAAWVAAHTDVRPLSAGRELSLDHWAASRWVLPELAPRSAYRTTVLPPGTVLHVPELDGYQAATFDYSWEGPYGLPQAYAYEHHLICLKIFLTRATKILAMTIRDPNVRSKEAAALHKGSAARTSAIAKLPIWATVTQTLDGLTTTHKTGTPPSVSAHAQHRAMCTP